MSPLSLSGPDFLLFFSIAGLACAGAVLALRRRVTRSWRRDDPAELARRLHPTEVAFLLHGLPRAVEAAITGLYHRGAVALEAGTLTRADAPGGPEGLAHDGVFRGVVAPASGALVERYVLSRLPAEADELCERTPGARLEEELTGKLEGEGLLVRDARRAGWILRLPALAWLALGALKLALGIARAQPVDGLLLVMFAGAALLVIFARAPRLTALGRRVAEALKASSAGLEATARTAPQQLSGDEMSLAYALFGHLVAPAAVLAILPSSHAAAVASAGGAGTGSSCGGASTGCGASCGGGGSGGCGGCGGCS